MKYPPYPLSTIELEKRASRYFRMSSENTMKAGLSTNLHGIFLFVFLYFISSINLVRSICMLGQMQEFTAPYNSFAALQEKLELKLN